MLLLRSMNTSELAAGLVHSKLSRTNQAAQHK